MNKAKSITLERDTNNLALGYCVEVGGEEIRLRCLGLPGNSLNKLHSYPRPIGAANTLSNQPRRKAMKKLKKILSKSIRNELFGVTISNRLTNGSNPTTRWFGDRSNAIFKKTVRLAK